MPASPLSSTTCPRPSLTCAQRARSRPTSCSRPMRGVRPLRLTTHPLLLLQTGIELAQGLYNAQSGPHRPLGIIFVRQGIAEIDQQAIAEILGDMPVIEGNHLGAGRLI